MSEVDKKWYGKQWNDAVLAAMDMALIEGAGSIVGEAKRNIYSNGTNFTGTLSGAISYNQPRTEATSRVVDIGIAGGQGDSTGQAAFRYAMSIEQGRRPGKAPPPGALDLWVRRKLKVDQDKVKGVAFLVGRKIKEQGSPAQPFMLPAFDLYKDYPRRRLADLLKQEIQRRRLDRGN